jgi:hypothetical protein
LVVDTRLSWPVLLIIVACAFLPFLEGAQFLAGHHTVGIIENTQALLLLFFAVFTYFFMQPLKMKSGRKMFWLWAVCWWIVLFGRSTSWGRDYFPEVPKIYFRIISIILIGSIVFPLFSSHLRKEIANQFKRLAIPIWGVILTLIGLIVSDAIEHGRYISTFILSDVKNKDLMEELFEFPLILGLFSIAFSVMKRDRDENLDSEN